MKPVSLREMRAIVPVLVKDPRLKSICAEIKETYCESFEWNCGGCFAFAEALATIPGTELWAVGQKEKDDWATQHAFVKFKDHYFDSSGEISAGKLLKKYGDSYSESKLGRVSDWIKKPDPNGLWYPQQEFVKNTEIDSVVSVFLTLLNEMRE